MATKRKSATLTASDYSNIRREMERATLRYMIRH